MTQVRVDADLRLDVDGSPVRLTGQDGHLTLAVEHPLTVLRASPRPARVTPRRVRQVGAALDVVARSGVVVDLSVRGRRVAVLDAARRSRASFVLLGARHLHVAVPRRRARRTD